MPRYEVEYNGKRYEVEAASPEAADAAVSELSAGPSSADIVNRGGLTGEDTSKELRSGVTEGLARVKAGFQNVAANAKDVYDLFVHGKPMPSGRFPNERSAHAKANADETLRRAIGKAQAQEQGVDLGERELLASATEGLALAGASELAVPMKATGMLGAMGKNAAMGATGAALASDPDDDSVKNDILIAAAAPPVLGLIPAFPAAVMNTIGKALRSGTSQRTMRAMEEAKNVLPNVKYSLAQRTGIPEMATLEAGAYNSNLTKFYADQTDTAISDAVAALRQPIDADILSNKTISVKARIEQELRRIQNTASSQWESGLAEAARLANRVEGGARIPVGNMRNQFDVLAQQAEDPLAHLESAGLKRSTVQTLRSITSGENPDISAQQLSSLLTGLTAMSKSTNGEARAVASKLRKSLDLDLDTLRDQGMLAADDATKAILDTRAEYQRAMAAKKMFAGEATRKLFNVGGEEAVNPEQLLSSFSKMDSVRQASVRKFLSEFDPDTLVSLRSKVIQEAQRSAQVRGAAADSSQTVEAFQTALFGKEGTRLKTVGLWDAQDLEKFDQINKGMSVIMNHRPGFKGAGTAIKAEDIAPNIVSLSGIFGARQFARFVMGNKADKLFTDPKFYEMFKTLNRSTTGSPINLVARAAIIEALVRQNAQADSDTAE